MRIACEDQEPIASYAKRNGAKLSEAFPVTRTDLDGDSTCAAARIGAAPLRGGDGFQGIASTLAKCGFEAVMYCHMLSCARS